MEKRQRLAVVDYRSTSAHFIKTLTMLMYDVSLLFRIKNNNNNKSTFAVFKPWPDYFSAF